jgi:mono/diheme cytochrome c family protein
LGHLTVQGRAFEPVMAGIRIRRRGQCVTCHAPRAMPGRGHPQRGDPLPQRVRNKILNHETACGVP